MSGNDSRVFYTQALPSEVHPTGTDVANKEEPIPQSSRKKSDAISNPQTPRTNQLAPKDMVRTDSRQQKLDKFINLTNSHESIQSKNIACK